MIRLLSWPTSEAQVVLEAGQWIWTRAFATSVPFALAYIESLARYIDS